MIRLKFVQKLLEDVRIGRVFAEFARFRLMRLDHFSIAIDEFQPSVILVIVLLPLSLLPMGNDSYDDKK